MVSLWHRAMVYLGIRDDDEFDDHAQSNNRNDGEKPPPQRERREPSLDRVRSQAEAGEHTPLDHGHVRPRDDSSTMTRPRPSEPARPQTTTAQVHLVEPQGFTDAQELERLQAGQPVMLNLRHLSRELQRRLVDFASGFAFAVGATIQKVDDQVLLLTPNDVEGSAE
jgi:FtsZ-interacting cell division protein YlmF